MDGSNTVLHLRASVIMEMAGTGITNTQQTPEPIMAATLEINKVRVCAFAIPTKRLNTPMREPELRAQLQAARQRTGYPFMFATYLVCHQDEITEVDKVVTLVSIENSHLRRIIRFV